MALRIIAGLRVPPGSNHSALATASAALRVQQGAIVGTPQFDKLSHFREIPEQLKKILSSRTLVQSKRLARFLSFVVEKEIAGNGSQLNEYLIAVEVYQRPSSFDPQIDTIVRTEARRLRSKLHQYYETEGIHDPILMEIPKGSYAPAFRERERGILEKEPG